MQALDLRKAGSHVRLYLVFYVALLCAAFTITVYYPGYMSPDSVIQLGQARNGVNDNLYPPVMDYIWSATDRVLPGPAGMLVLQNAVFWYALALLAFVVVARPLWQVVFVLLAGSWPPTYCTLGTIWKDVGMQAFLLASLAAMLYAPYRRRVWPLGIAVLCLFLAAGYRHNGIAAAPPLLALCMLELALLVPQRLPRLDAYLRKRTLVRAFYPILGLLCLAVTLGTLDFVNNYHKVNSRLWGYFMLHDLAGISVQQNAKYLPDYIDPTNEISAGDLK
ncbi:MAG: hypothetical protein NTW28_02650, partial [Candidatus Solibacter sp.]|nr:hypothetical protein [Candidatus Solibacter sp.]